MAGQDVKIGDFGLATTLETIPASVEGSNMVSSGTLAPVRSAQHQHQHQHQLDSSGRLLLDGSEDMTGEVGTALYTAPEIVRKQGARYGYKVSLDSLLTEEHHGLTELALCCVPGRHVLVGHHTLRNVRIWPCLLHRHGASATSPKSSPFGA